jgi:hypothetical protein
MIAFIDDHCGAYGVEPICRVLPIAPSTYYDHVARRRDPSRRSARANAAGDRSDGSSDLSGNSAHPAEVGETRDAVRHHL